MSGWRLTLTARSSYLVGGVGQAPLGSHVAAPFLAGRHLEDEEALLPGTSVRGVVRDAFRRFVEARTEWTCAAPDQCDCPCCRLFGSGNRTGKLMVRSGRATAARDPRSRIALDRATRTAARAGHALWTEERARADFTIDLELRASTDSEEARLLDDFWPWLSLVGLALGRSKSTGGGSFEINVVSHEREQPRHTRAPSTESDAPPRSYLLSVTLLEPARLVGIRQRDFFRDALQSVPSATLRGAIGWAMQRRGDDALATELFRSSTSVRLGTAYPTLETASLSGAVPWLSVQVCRGEPRHRVNLALAKVAWRMGSALQLPEVCPRCGAHLEEPDGDGAGPLVIGRTAIDPHTRSVAQDMLYYETVAAPGSTFVAYMLARPGQAEAIAHYSELLIGGRTAAGRGLARLQVLPLDVPSLESRLAGTAQALAALGVAHETIAILGFVSEAGMGAPLRQVLMDRGLPVLTAELRSIVRGGWDQERGYPRSLRQLISGGSWVAVEAGGESALHELERLERFGIADPDGTAHAMLLVREDWEVMEMTPPTRSVAATEVDDLILGIVDICRQYARQLPDRSALQTLLRYAQSTDSVQETILFIRYQASREEHGRNRAFFIRIAEEVERRFPRNIEGARRYLAFVVRAANVERPHGPHADATEVGPHGR
jgi:hypothetical protein